ncbi:hypothetical protein [Streptococcus hyovaginalis]|uniref:hypothetical protein n=1 Tax=Streptococcus hyovaginalis TaxID=149015 RepID=UPI00146B3C4C|nr:hypothetical protein [Streptococcus hyovaginalis]MDY3023980.1 hypothetical protein [Streptococcus hyovaginalis]
MFLSHYVMWRDSRPSASKNSRNGTNSSASYLALKSAISYFEKRFGSNVIIGVSTGIGRSRLSEK